MVIAEMVSQLPIIAQEIQPIADQAANLLQQSWFQIAALTAFVGCIKVKMPGGATQVLTGTNPAVPDGAKKIGEKASGAKLGDDPDTGGVYRREHVCNPAESEGTDGNGWMYKLVPTGKPRKIDARTADEEVYN